MSLVAKAIPRASADGVAITSALKSGDEASASWHARQAVLRAKKLRTIKLQKKN